MKTFFRTKLTAIVAMALSTVALAAFPDPYPPVTFANGVDPITNVNFAGINNTTDPTVDGTPDHEDFTHIVGSVTAGNQIPMSVQGNTDGEWDDWITVYIDWNQNGIFDRGGDEEYRFPEPLHDSTGIDGKTTEMEIAIPLDALAGSTRMRVLTKYGSIAAYAAPDNTDGWGQAEDYTINVTRLSEPNVAKVFVPPWVETSAPSTLVITLGNTENIDDATLLTDFTDTFPADLEIAAVPNASSSCGNAVLTANPGAGFITLAGGASIPAGGACTIKVDVESSIDSTYENTIAAGALQTDQGNSPFDAAAALRVGIVFPEPYCTIMFSGVEPISRVAFANIDNPSDPAFDDSPEHEDFTAIVGLVVAGSTVSLVVEGNTGFGLNDTPYTSEIMAYFDWNGDGDFNDYGEEIEVGSITGSDGADGKNVVADIQILPGAIRGRTRMRITKSFQWPTTQACGSYAWGQAEDYTIEILDPLIFEDGFED